MKSFRFYAKAVCGFLLVYITAGGLAGASVDMLWLHTDCFHKDSVFMLIATKCSDNTISFFWSVIVAWPRFIIVIPSIFIAMLIAAVRNGFDVHYLANGVPFLLYSLPLALVVWLGFQFWKSQTRFAAWMLCGLLAAEIFRLSLLQ